MNNKKIHVGFDLDGVIADWVQAYTKHSNKRNGTPVLKSDSSDIPEFSMYPWYQSRDEFIDTFMEWVKQPRAFTNIPDVSTANTMAANKINKSFETTYITARNPPLDSSDVYMQTRAWLDRRGLTGRLFINEEKGKLCKAFNIDYYIDDKPENLLDIMKHSPNTVPVLMKRTYQTLEDQQKFPMVSDVTDYHTIIRLREK